MQCWYKKTRKLPPDGHAVIFALPRFASCISRNKYHNRSAPVMKERFKKYHSMFFNICGVGGGLYDELLNSVSVGLVQGAG